MAKITEYQTGYAQVGVVTSIGRGQIVPWASVGNAPEQEADEGRKPRRVAIALRLGL